MAGYGKQLKKLLKDAGCYKERSGKGDHEWWYSPISKLHFVVDAGCKSKHTANETLKQAGLQKAF